MKLYYIGILKNQAKPAVELCSEYDLSDFSRWNRSNYQEFMDFFSRTVAERTGPGQRQTVTDKETSQGSDDSKYHIHCYSRTEGVAGVFITDSAYDNMSAHRLLSKVVDEFLVQHPPATWRNSNAKVEFPALKEYIKLYQDPGQGDNITKIQKELDETKGLVQKTINSVLERGEKIDSLVAKSDGLSASSKMFYTQAKKQNSCCTIM